MPEPRSVTPEQAREAGYVQSRTLCPECGPGVAVDEDGLCSLCGATATGPWCERACAALRAAAAAAQPDPEADVEAALERLISGESICTCGHAPEDHSTERDNESDRWSRPCCLCSCGEFRGADDEATLRRALAARPAQPTPEQIESLHRIRNGLLISAQREGSVGGDPGMASVHVSFRTSLEDLLGASDAIAMYPLPASGEAKEQDHA